MEPESLIDDLSSLFEAHGVPFHTENEWLVPYSALPAVRATWLPRDDSGRLDVDVLLEEDRVIHECFAGFGEGDVGKLDGIRNFCHNSFHVLLAAFWQKPDPEQVMMERWQIGDRTYDAFVGGFGTRTALGADAIELPDGVFEAIEATLKGASLTKTCHWARHFYADVQGDQTFEALLDNDRWAPGEAALTSIAWPATKGYHSVRNFLVLRAVSGANT